ncbi:MAG TPA: murein biosynthesis integral membrane protein MurJ [Anaerolineae bacterium]|nr:murein biosynthesis integral membrane protein MurJ [Anaerolineae bacterium]
MKHIARSSLIIAFFFGIDKVLGLVRQILIAHEFGLTHKIDVFNAANNIPDLLSALISGGALGVALIPVLSEYLKKKGRPAAWELFARILNLAFLFTAGLSVLIMAFANPLVTYIIAPGFSPSQQILTIELMRLDLIAILIFSISGLVMAGLQANQHFTLPAMAPALYNIGQIFGITILAPHTGFSLGSITFPSLGLGIHGLVYGVILGASLHLLIQIPGLIHYQFVWVPVINLRDSGVRKVLYLMGPRVATMFFVQIFFITRDNLASHLGEGAITALNYGWFIMQVPETLIGSALAIVLLPTLAEFFAKGEQGAYQETINTAIKTLLALTIPIAVLLAIGLRPMVWVLGFDQAGTDMVVWVTRFYLLGLTSHTLLELASRSFYAKQDALTPLLAAFLNAIGYIFFAILFSRLWQQNGIALANSLSFTLEALLLLFLLNRKFPGILKTGDTIPRAGIGTIISGGVVFTLLRILPIGKSSPILSASITGGILIIGALIALPFVHKEIKILIHL